MSELVITNKLDTSTLEAALNSVNSAIVSADKLCMDLDTPVESLRTVEPKQLKKLEQGLSSSIKEVDEARKKFKSIWMQPLNEVEASVKDRTRHLKQLHETYKSVRIDNEEEIKRSKEIELREFYEDLGGALCEVIAYEDIAKKTWTNLSVSIDKAKQELEDIVVHIAHDWEALKTLDIPNYEDAELEFFKTRDLTHAIQHAKQIREDKARIEEMKSYLPQAVEPEIDPTPMAAPEPVQETEPVQARPSAASPTIERYVDVAIPRIMIIESATVEQCKKIGAFCGSLGVTGTFKSGTLSEVIRKEYRA